MTKPLTTKRYMFFTTPADKSGRSQDLEVRMAGLDKNRRPIRDKHPKVRELHPKLIGFLHRRGKLGWSAYTLNHLHKKLPNVPDRTFLCSFATKWQCIEALKLALYKDMTLLAVPTRPLGFQMEQMILDNFDQTDQHFSSPRAGTLPYIMRHCFVNKLRVDVEFHPGAGYIVKKVGQQTEIPLV